MKNFSEYTPEELDAFAKETGGIIVDPSSESNPSENEGGEAAPDSESANQDQGGFFKDVGEAGGKAVDRVKGAFSRAYNDNQDPISTGVQTVGAGAGFVQDVVGAGLKSAYKNIVPHFVQKGISEAGQSVLGTSVGQEGLQAIGKGLDYYDRWKKKHPTVANDLESAVDIASLLPIGKGGQLAKEGAVAGREILQEEAGNATKSVLQHLAERKLNKVADYIAPVASAAEKEAAIAENRVVRSLIRRDVAILPSEETYAVAKKIGNIIDPGKGFEHNISSVNREVSRIAKKEITPYLERNNFYAGKDQVRAALESVKTEKPLHFITESSEGSTYDKIIKTAMDAIEENSIKPTNKTVDQLMKGWTKEEIENLAKIHKISYEEQVQKMLKPDKSWTESYSIEPLGSKKKPYGRTKIVVDSPSTTIDAKGMWEARKKFDTLVNERFPKAFDHPDSSSMNKAIMNVRRAMNDYIAEGTKDGAFKKYMSHLSDLYDARDNMKDKLFKEIGTSALSRWVKGNPGKAKILGLAAGALGVGKGYEILKGN